MLEFYKDYARFYKENARIVIENFTKYDEGLHFFVHPRAAYE